VVLVPAVRWWRGPSPESEAAKYFDRFAPGAARVDDCVWVEDPEGSDLNTYWCTVEADRFVPRGYRGAADVRAGRHAYCFYLPGAGEPLRRVGGNPSPRYAAAYAEDCG
jgi:hypothetical protein